MTMAFDPVRNRTVLFGGVVPATGMTTNQVWEWDGSTWTQRVVGGVAPAARTGHVMAWDAARERMIVYGGGTPFPANDTWELGPGGWKLLDSEGPGPRLNASAAYDSARAGVVLFGGSSQSLGRSDNSTWLWDGRTWKEVAPTAPPAQVERTSVVFDDATGEIVMLGTIYSANRGVHAWDGARWRLATFGAPNFSGDHLAYDPVRQVAVLVGRTSGGIFIPDNQPPQPGRTRGRRGSRSRSCRS